MPDYKEMYYELFNQITDTIETLKLIQQQAEVMCIKSDDTQVVLLERTSNSSGRDIESQTPKL